MKSTPPITDRPVAAGLSGNPIPPANRPPSQVETRRPARVYELKPKPHRSDASPSLPSKTKPGNGPGQIRKAIGAKQLARDLKQEVEELKKLRRRLVMWIQHAKEANPKLIAAVLGCLRPQSEAYWVDVQRAWKGPPGLSTEQLRGEYQIKLEKTARQRVQCLNRGVSLVAEAASWRTAKIGSPGSELASVRGKQWRLAAAWAGTELLADTFYPREFFAPKLDYQTEWCIRLGLETLVVPIPVPRFLPSIASWRIFGTER